MSKGFELFEKFEKTTQKALDARRLRKNDEAYLDGTLRSDDEDNAADEVFSVGFRGL
jgi:hypothetical protein